MRRSLLLSLTGLVVGGGAFLLLRPWAAPPAPLEPVGSSRPDERPTGAPVLESGKAPAHERAAWAGRCVLRGVVRRAGQLAGARIEVTLLRRGAPPPERPLSHDDLLGMFDAPARGGALVATTTAGPDGRFVASGLGPGRYEVRAVAEDGARGVSRADVAPDGVHATLAVELAAARERLRGRVTYADGRPFVGVAQCGSATAPIGADGRFLLEGLEAGQAIVWALEPGAVVAAGKPLTIPHEGEYVLVVDEDAEVREGVVRAADDGTPIPGARVLSGNLGWNDEQTLLVLMSTDAEGRFVVRVPSSGRGSIRVTAPGFAPLRTELGEAPRKPASIEMRLARGARLAGRVTSGREQRPLPGVMVRVFPIESGYRFSPTPAFTNARGEYEHVDLPAGEAVVFVDGAEWASPEAARTEDWNANALQVVLTAGQVAYRDLHAVAAARAEGVVLDEYGRPVVGAVVRAEGRTGATSFWFGGAMENAKPEAAATSTDGTFEIRGLVPEGTYGFTAQLPDGKVATVDAWIATADAGPVEIRVRAVRRLSVTVQGDDERPLPGAEGWLESGFLDSTSSTVTAGSDGLLTLEHRLADPLALIVTAPDHEQERLDVPNGAETLTVRLRRTHLLSGRVVLPDGSPAAGADLVVYKSEGQPDDSSEYRVSAGSDGSFELTFASPGRRVVRASLQRGTEGLATFAVGEAGGTLLVLVLSATAPTQIPPGTLTVRVIGPDGRAVSNARVRYESGSLNMPELPVHDGRVHFHVGERRRAWVTVLDATSADGTPLAPAREGPVQATTDEVVVRVGQARVIEGVVLGPDGAGAPGLEVAARAVLDADSEAWLTFTADATTDASGRFRLERLADHKYLVSVGASREFFAPDAQTVRAGATDVTFRLTRSLPIAITVLDPEGKPVKGAQVDLEPIVKTEGTYLSPTARTDRQGVARPTSVDPAHTYNLEVRPPWNSDLLSTSRPAWTPADLTVTLERGVSIRGMVKDPAGRPVTGVAVWASHGRSVRHVGVDRDGRFVLPGLSRQETVEFHVGFEADVGSYVAHGSPVRAGTQDLVLTFDSGLELPVQLDDYGTPVDTGEPPMALLLDPTAKDDSALSAPIRSNGSLRFRGLVAGKVYALWVPPDEDGRSIWRADVRAQAEPLRVKAEVGRSIRVRLEGAPPTARPSVRAYRGRAEVGRGEAEPSGEGTYEIAGLPPGRWTVSAWVLVDDTSLEGEVEAEAGSEVRIVLAGK